MVKINSKQHITKKGVVKRNPIKKNNFDVYRGRYLHYGDISEIRKQTLSVANSEQKNILDNMMEGDEVMFYNDFIRYINYDVNNISRENIDKCLMVSINSVEGDTSQLSDELVEYANKKGWLRGWD